MTSTVPKKMTETIT